MRAIFFAILNFMVQGEIRSEENKRRKTQIPSPGDGNGKDQSTRGRGRRIRTSVAGGTGNRRAEGGRLYLRILASPPRNFLLLSWFSYFYSSDRPSTLTITNASRVPFFEPPSFFYYYFLLLIFFIIFPINCSLFLPQATLVPTIALFSLESSI